MMCTTGTRIKMIQFFFCPNDNAQVLFQRLRLGVRNRQTLHKILDYRHYKNWYGEHGKVIGKFEELTTSPDGPLGQLEEVLDSFNAKRLLSHVFKVGKLIITK